MRLPKTIAGIPVILLVLMPCIYCIWFQVEHHMIRVEMREKLERDNLQTITVPVKDFRWYEEDREILVDGVMFDVKTITQRGDNYIITGLFDEAETELHIAMGRLQQRESEGPDAVLISIILSQTLISPAAHELIHYSHADDLSSRNLSRDEKLYNTILSLHTPPPRSA